MRRFLIPVLLSGVVAMGCAGVEPTNIERPASYQIIPPPAEVVVGQDSSVNLAELGLAVQRLVEGGEPVTIPGPNTTTQRIPRLSYFPSDKDMFVVDPYGVLTAKRGGTGSLLITGYDQSLTVQITVVPHPATTVRLSVLSGPAGTRIPNKLDTGTFYALPADLESSRIEGLVLVGTDTVFCSYCASTSPARTQRVVRYRSLNEAKLTVTNPTNPFLHTGTGSIDQAGRVRALDTSTTPVGIVMEVPGDSGVADKWADTVYIKLKLRPIDTITISPGTFQVTGRIPSEQTASLGNTNLLDTEDYPGDTSGTIIQRNEIQNFEARANFFSIVNSVQASTSNTTPAARFISIQNTNSTQTSYRPTLPNVTWESALPGYLTINSGGGVVAPCEYIGRVGVCPTPVRTGTVGGVNAATRTQNARDSLVIQCVDNGRRLPGTKQAVAPATTGELLAEPIQFGGIGTLNIPSCPIVTGTTRGPNIPTPGAYCTSASAIDPAAYCVVYIRASIIDPATGNTKRRLYRITVRK